MPLNFSIFNFQFSHVQRPYLQHLRHRSQRRHGAGLSAPSHRDHSHAQHRRHCPSHLPDDGNWRLRLHDTGAHPQARHHLVALPDQPHHLNLQQHRLRHQNLQRLLQEEKVKPSLRSVSKWDVAFVAFVDFVLTAHARPSGNKFSWCSLNRSLA